MKLTLAEPKYLREPIIIISELVNEVRIKIDKEKIEIIAMDPANVAMVLFKLLSSAFVEYDLNKPVEIAINLDSLKQILKRAKPTDTLTLGLDQEKNKLKIILKGDSIRSFDLSLINIDEQEQKIPNLNFPARIETLSYLFDDAISDMDVVSDSVSLIAEPTRFIVQAEGNLSNAKMEVLPNEETVIKMDSEKIKAKYSIEYLKKIIKGSKLSDNVVLQFAKDYPLKIEYKIIDKLDLAFILAPRVSNE